MRGTVFLCGLLITTIAGCLGWSLFFKSSGLSKDRELLKNELAALRASLNSVQQQQQQQQQFVARSLALAAQSGPQVQNAAPVVANRQESSAKDLNVEEGMKVRRERAAIRSKEFAEKFDTRILSEAVDRYWGRETTAAIEAIFSDNSAGRLIAADCKTNLCRVVVENQSIAEQRDLAKQILTRAPFDQDVFFRYDHDSVPPKTTMYVARAGMRLPQLLK